MYELMMLIIYVLMIKFSISEGVTIEREKKKVADQILNFTNQLAESVSKLTKI
jgi:hypothetical protein